MNEQLNFHVLLWRRFKRAKYMREWTKKHPEYGERVRLLYSKERAAERWQKWSKKNKAHLAEYRKDNREKISARMEKWYKETGYNRRYFLANRKKILPKLREYFHANKAKIHERAKADPFYFLKKAIRHAVERITNRGAVKTANSVKYLGCSLEFARAHIESKFKLGMTWENHGQWEIDHIKPISSFDFTDPQSAFIASRWDNLQPLWKEENRSKHAKIA